MNIWKGLIPKKFDKQKIAIGSYSSVYKMKFYDNIFAIKVSKFIFSSIDIKEIAVMIKLDHPNIMKILSVWIDEDLHFIYLMPLAKTLLSNIMFVKYLIYTESAVRRNFFKGLFSALEYLHSHHVWHRDIKPSNILVFEGDIPMLCDFGLAAVMTNVQSDFLITVVTEFWRAPELFKLEPYSEKIDIWSLGLIMFEMHITFHRNKYYPFVHCDFFEKEQFKDTKIEEKIELLQNIDKLMSIFPSIEDESPVIKACLEFDPQKRKSASEILTFDYFCGGGYPAGDIPRKPPYTKGSNCEGYPPQTPLHQMEQLQGISSTNSLSSEGANPLSPEGANSLSPEGANSLSSEGANAEKRDAEKFKYIGEIKRDILIEKFKYDIVKEHEDTIIDITRRLLDKYANNCEYSLDTIKEEVLVCFMYIAAIILLDHEIIIPPDLYKNILWILVELNFDILCV